MAALDWELTRTGGITLVELFVTSETDERVRIESELTPVWPPRRQGVPADGWDKDTFEGTVEAGTTLVVGYASPAEPVDPPAKLVSPDSGETVTPRDLVRSLGEAGPTRDAITTDQGGDPTRPDERVTQSDGEDTYRDDRQGDDPETAHADPTAWFDTLADRLEAAEQLAGVQGVEEARDAVVSVGGLEDVRRLQAQLDADRRQLEQVRQRSTTLADRLDAVDIPLGTLERVT